MIIIIIIIVIIIIIIIIIIIMFGKRVEMVERNWIDSIPFHLLSSELWMLENPCRKKALQFCFSLQFL